jgi:hypothetical protein
MPSRTYSEILAESELALEEAERISGELQAKLESTRRVREYVHKNVTSASKRLKECRVLVDEAKKLAETERDKANTKYERAHERLGEAHELLGRLKFVSNADPKDEWKECRASIARFDKLLVNLRRTGFIIVTVLIGAAAYLFQKADAAGALARSPDIKLTVTVSLLGLIAALYLIDSAHRKSLKAAADRAIELEELLGYRLTQEIKTVHSRVRAFFAGKLFYAVLFLAVADIFLISEGQSLSGLAQGIWDGVMQLGDRAAHL